MVTLALPIVAHAHPGAGERLAVDAHERLVDDTLLGPLACLETDATVRWTHRAGGYTTSGEAVERWRFDHRIWRMDRRELTVADPDSLDVIVAPMLFGTAIHVDLSYPITRRRRMEWPGPVATLPVRTFGEVATVSVDELAAGSKRIVVGFGWDGWKDVAGARSVTFADGMVPVIAAMEVTDRWPNGCKVRSSGTAELGPAHLPVHETWRFDGACALGTDWTAEWTFAFGAWRPCAFSGPARGDAL